MSDKKDQEWARKTVKTAEKGSAEYIEATGILSRRDPEKETYRKTTRSKPQVIKKMGGGYIEKEMIKKKHGGKVGRGCGAAIRGGGAVRKS